MSLDRKITDLLPGQIPDYVQEFYPLFVIFVTKYYEWLDQEGGPQQIIQNIQLNRDIDTTASSLATKFVATYAPNMPQESALDRAVLIKHFRDFYRAKGSEKSFEFFFRAFFNDEISVKLPGDQLFKTSAGNWYVEKTLRVRADVGNPEDLLHTTITGTDSGATGVIEKVVKNYDKWSLTLQNRSLVGTFSSSETITGYSWDFTTNVSSLVSVINTEPLNIAPGRQLGTNSLLSSDQIIQDSVYWQKFSYVIKTRVNYDVWKNAILEQIHPTGRNMFGEMNIDNTSSITVTSNFIRNTAIETQVKVFGDSSDFYVVPGVTWDRLADYKTGTSETTTAGAISYDAAYTFGGENVTFALQSLADATVTFTEDLEFTSVTGVVSIDVTTANTTIGRDVISYVMPTTSITGTLNAEVQPGGEEITFTGTGTLFSTELPEGNNWRLFTGERDAGLNPIYTYYSSVLTIRDLAVTGTLTIAAQTPVAPNYYIYATGTSTRLQQDLLVAGTSATVSRETDRPIIDPNTQEPVLFKINDMPVTGAVSFSTGTTTAHGTGTYFLDQLASGNTITITKPLSGRLTQVSSIPATITSYATQLTVASAVISGSSLTSSFGTSDAVKGALASTYGVDRYGRYDVPTPFPVYLMGISSNTVYVHSNSFISLVSSSATSNKDVYSIKIAETTNKYLNNVYYGVSGTTPNREFKVSYDGTIYRPSYVTTYNLAEYTSQTLRGAAALGTALTMTTGTNTNGYTTINLPWNFYYYGTSVSSIHVGHNSVVGFGSASTYYQYGDSSVTRTINQLYPYTNYGDDYYYTNVGMFMPIESMNDTQWDGSNYIYPDSTKMIKLYSKTLGTAPNRVHVVRYEGDTSTAVTTGSIVWELEFSESDQSSLTLNFGSTPAAQYWMSNANEFNAFVPKPYLAVDPTTAGLYVKYQAWNGVGFGVGNTSSALKVGLQGTYRSDPASTRFETTFYENSSLGVDVSVVGSPYFSNYTTAYRYAYNQTAGSTYSWTIELSESAATSPSGMVTGVASITNAGGLFNFKPVKRPARDAIVGSSPSYTNNLVLMTLANVSDFNTDATYGNYKTLYSQYNSTDAGPMTYGVISRWPQDTWEGSSSVNPTCALTTSITYGYKYSYRVVPWGSLITGYGSSTATGYLFSYGTSSNSRFLMTKSTYGRLHSISGNTWSGPANNITAWNDSDMYSNSGQFNSTYPSWTTLAPSTSATTLGIWFSKAENPPQVPTTQGVSPSAYGWTFYGYAAVGTVSSVYVKTNWSASMSSSSPFKMTWLLWQDAFTPTTTSATQRLSEFLVTDMVMYGSPYSSGDSTSSFGKFAQSSIMPRVTTELTSGAIVRLAVNSDRSGNTTLVDYFVAEDPTIRGDQYLVLAKDWSSSTPLSGFINSSITADVNTPYQYFLGLQAVQGYAVETRVIDTVLSDTSFTVTTSWSVTANTSWGPALQSATSTRVFGISSIPSSNSIILTAPFGRTTASPVSFATSGNTAIADRRFTIVSINNDEDITVSGGGIYAAFAGKTSKFPKIEAGNLTISGYHDLSNLTSETTWFTNGFPGLADSSFGVFSGNDYQQYTTIDIEGSSFTVVSVVNDTTILVTGSPILTNLYDVNLVSYFPAPATTSTMYGTGTKFSLYSTSYAVGANTSILTTEEVTEYDGTDRRIGFIRVDGRDYRIWSIDSDTALTVSHTFPITESIVGQPGSAFRRTREYGSVRQVARVGSATFDRAGSTVTTDESLVAEGNNVDFDKYIEFYHSDTALALTATATIVSTSITLQATSTPEDVTSLSNYLLLVTWMKDLNDNANEAVNELRITLETVSSDATVFTWDASDEVQRNSKDIAIGRTLMYSDIVYVNSSNSIVETTTSTSPYYTKTWDWTPYSKNRSGTYSRFAVRIGGAFTTSLVTSVTLNIGITVPAGAEWNATSSDFLNVTVIGAE